MRRKTRILLFIGLPILMIVLGSVYYGYFSSPPPLIGKDPDAANTVFDHRTWSVNSRGNFNRDASVASNHVLRPGVSAAKTWSVDLLKHLGRKQINWQDDMYLLASEKYVVVGLPPLAHYYPSEILCFGRNDGKVLWQSGKSDFLDHEKVVPEILGRTHERLYCSGNMVRSYDLATGKLVWEFSDERNYVGSSALIYKGAILFSGIHLNPHSIIRGKDYVHSLRLDTGQPIEKTGLKSSGTGAWSLVCGEKAYLFDDERILEIAPSGETRWVPFSLHVGPIFAIENRIWAMRARNFTYTLVGYDEDLKSFSQTYLGGTLCWLEGGIKTHVLYSRGVAIYSFQVDSKEQKLLSKGREGRDVQIFNEHLVEIIGREVHLISLTTDQEIVVVLNRALHKVLLLEDTLIALSKDGQLSSYKLSP